MRSLKEFTIQLMCCRVFLERNDEIANIDEQIQKLKNRKKLILNQKQIIIMPEQYKRFGIKVSKIDGISLGACLSIDTYNKEGYLYINLIKWEVCIGWMWFDK